MSQTRRGFLKTLGVLGVGGSAAGRGASRVLGSTAVSAAADSVGVLVDIPNCIGCRKCEYACQEAAGFEPPPIDAFDDKSAFAADRRPGNRSYTVVNRLGDEGSNPPPAYTKFNCFHCVDPACVSACLVGAFQKQPNGPVVYEASRCMGCRYCMVACPFGIPTYEYGNAFTPQVRKCTFCAEKIADGDVPACVKICPRECLIFGQRSELLALAHEKIRKDPDRYLDHVYGEHEAGGTSWLYLSSIPFEELGFLNIGGLAPPRLTESIQHGVFKHFVPPLALYGLLGIVMWLARQKMPPVEVESVPVQTLDPAEALVTKPKRRTPQPEGASV